MFEISFDLLSTTAKKKYSNFLIDFTDFNLFRQTENQIKFQQLKGRSINIIFFRFYRGITYDQVT